MTLALKNSVVEKVSLRDLLQGDQKVFLQLTITIYLATWLFLAVWQPNARARGTLDSH
jgi:hypothetical protein